MNQFNGVKAADIDDLESQYSMNSSIKGSRTSSPDIVPKSVHYRDELPNRDLEDIEGQDEEDDEKLER